MSGNNTENTSLIKLIRMNSLQFLFGIASYISKQYSIGRDSLKRNVLKTDAGFQDLAPVDEIEKGDVYFNALDWALKNKNIYNIAMTGPYGSGKSSIIKAYLKRRPSTKYIDISLASFMEEAKDENGLHESNLVGFGEKQIEEGILKQLFYKVDFKKIPQSRYRKLHNVSGVGIFVKILMLIIIFGLIILYLFPGMYTKALNIVINASNSMQIGVALSWLVAIILASSMLAIVSWGVWWISSKYRIKELSIADGASLSQKNEEEISVFNRNMDEIVYFFEATDFDTVFIEDLDRLENTEIFIKLRELNNILNNYEMIKRRIVFVYAIKDEMFADKDRTKFFDFIIPVIPIINSTNSGEKLSEKLEESTFNCNISKEYITKISPYIDDMRIMKNILNEFIIYKNTLRDIQDLDLEDEQMLSLMIIKNLYPKDFAQLQAETGIIKAAFKDKEKFISSQRDKIISDRKKLESILESVDSDVLVNIRELKFAMLYYLTKEQGMVNYIQIKGNQYSFNEIMNDDFDMHILKDSRINVHYYDKNRYPESHTIENIDEIIPVIGKKMGYIERWEYLVNSAPEQKKELKDRIEVLNSEEHDIRSLSIKELLSKYEVQTILSEDVRNNKLLVFMLRNGYIDDTYATYINYFHPNSITKDDMNFILGLRNHEAKEFNYKIIKIEQVIVRLLDYEFEQKEIYNFDLLEHLLIENNDCLKYKLFILQLADENEHSWKFTNEFADITKALDLFIESLGSVWIGMWKYIYNNATLTDERKIFYFKLILNNVNIEKIKKMNFDNDVKHCLENDIDILNKIKDISSAKIKPVIRELDIHFSELRCDGIPQDILEYIFDNNYYEINSSMIKNIINLKQPDEVDKLLLSNYTVIRNVGYQPLISYLNDNFENYVNNIILKLETNNFESFEVVICMMEKLIDNTDILEKLIVKEEITISNLDICCFDKIGKYKQSVKVIWDKLLSLKKVIVSWDNIMLYWKQFKLTSQLLDFIEQNIDELLRADDIECVKDDMIKAVLIEEMSMEAYKKFASNFKVIDFNMDISEFSQEQMHILLECNYFELTAERYLEIKKEFPDLSKYFIICNKDKFFTTLEEYELDITEIEGLVTSEDMTADEKVTILTIMDISEMTLPIARIIRNIIRGLGTSIDKSIVEAAWEILPEDERYELFKNQMQVYSKDELEEKFREFGGVYNQLTDRSRRHKVILNDDEYNRKLMKYLNSINYLTSVEYESQESYDIIANERKTVSKFIVGWIKKNSM